MEIRAGAELRAEPESKKLIGHAAVFNKRSLDLGGFVEIIQPGAFKNSLNNDIRALIDHRGIAIARTGNGTLKVEEDEVGLRFEIDLPDTTAGLDIYKSIQRGDVDQMSFGFTVREGGQIFTEDEDGTIIRTLTDINVLEGSIVTFPAYPDTDVAARSVQAWLESKSSYVSNRLRMKDGLRRRRL